MTFRERFMNGEIDFDEIFDETDRWSFSDETCTLREFLGLTPKEEDVWVCESDEALEELMERERKTKVLFLDLDGTLLNDDKEFTPENQQAIHRALMCGHKVVISTGRPLTSAAAIAKELGLTQEGCFAIAYNGGEIYDLYRQKSLYRKTIPLPYVRHIFECASEWGLHCQTYDSRQLLALSENRELKTYVARTKMPYLVDPDLLDHLREEPVKMIVIDLDDHEKLVRFSEATNQWAHGKLDRVFSSVDYLEHIAPGISKGAAMDFLCSYLGIPHSNTIAAGDAENDISMLRAAAVSAAMANAEDCVKDIADYVTKNDNNHDGVAEIIEKFML